MKAMYIVMAMSIGSVNKSLNGFPRIREARCPKGTLTASMGAYHLLSPVSLRFRSAFLFKIMGAYVSGSVKIMKTKQPPENIVRIQKSHL